MADLKDVLLHPSITNFVRGLVGGQPGDLGYDMMANAHHNANLMEQHKLQKKAKEEEKKKKKGAMGGALGGAVGTLGVALAPFTGGLSLPAAGALGAAAGAGGTALGSTIAGGDVSMGQVGIGALSGMTGGLGAAAAPGAAVADAAGKTGGFLSQAAPGVGAANTAAITGTGSANAIAQGAMAAGAAAPIVGSFNAPATSTMTAAPATQDPTNPLASAVFDHEVMKQQPAGMGPMTPDVPKELKVLPPPTAGVAGPKSAFGNKTQIAEQAEPTTKGKVDRFFSGAHDYINKEYGSVQNLVSSIMDNADRFNQPDFGPVNTGALDPEYAERYIANVNAGRQMAQRERESARSNRARDAYTEVMRGNLNLREQMANAPVASEENVVMPGGQFGTVRVMRNPMTQEEVGRGVAMPQGPIDTVQVQRLAPDGQGMITETVPIIMTPNGPVAGNPMVANDVPIQQQIVNTGQGGFATVNPYGGDPQFFNHPNYVQQTATTNMPAANRGALFAQAGFDIPVMPEAADPATNDNLIHSSIVGGWESQVLNGQAVPLNPAESFLAQYQKYGDRAIGITNQAGHDWGLVTPYGEFIYDEGKINNHLAAQAAAAGGQP